MSKIIKKILALSLFASAMFATSAMAAPGLTISGTDFMYNGKKIFFLVQTSLGATTILT